MTRETKRVLAAFAGLFVIVVLAGLGLRLAGEGKLVSPTVLEVDLQHGFPEAPEDDPVAKLISEERLTLRDLIATLDYAGRDKAVRGLVARVDTSGIGMAQAQEIRDAIGRFRARKKFAYAFSETFGEASSGNVAYYLATGFEEIWLQPSGDVGLNGLFLQSPFIRGTLDKLGLKPEFGKRHEYKSAADFYTETKFTEAHREANERLKDSWFSQIVRGIAAGRKLPEAEVRALAERGPLLGREALKARLVDGLAYRDEVFDKAKKRGGKDSKLLYLSRYRDRTGKKEKGRHKLALVYAVGGIIRGESNEGSLMGPLLGSETLGDALREASEDDDVEAIILRVDCPGGSYIASDTVWRETVLAKENGKPVIVSMGDVAASGGYFVSMAADKIVAQPGTITGSIGVLYGKMVATGLLDKLGISFDGVRTGEHADMYAITQEFSPSEWARVNAFLDRIYEDFTSKVAAGRKLPRQKVLEIAKGRVWTGEDAKALGLVDELGGLETAVRLARRSANIPDGESVRLQVFPEPRSLTESLWDKLLGRGEEKSSDREAAARLLVQTVRALRPLIRELGLVDTRGVLSMPPGEGWRQR